MSESQQSADAVIGVFSAFRRSWFRRFWWGRSLATAGLQIQRVARDWLVYSLTGSSLSISIVVSSWSFSTLLFSLVGGATADRFDRRKLLTIGQAACALVMLVIAGLSFTDAIRVWHLLVSTFVLAVLFSFVIPARAAVMGDLSPAWLLLNAMALSTAGTGLMKIASSSVSGLLVEKLSSATAFVATAFLFAGTAWFYSRLPAGGTGLERATPIRQIVTEGGRYILERPELMMLFGLELARALFFQYTTLLPAVAGDVYNMGGLALGLLRGARGVGSLAASLMIAWRGGARGRYGLLLASGWVAGLGLILFGQVRSLGLAVAVLSVAAIGESVYLITRSTLLQSVGSKRMRGRMVGFRRLIWGIRPLGGLPTGALADAIGPLPTATLEGAVLTVLFGAVALWRTRMLRSKRTTGTW